jgi:hypothetical protein
MAEDPENPPYLEEKQAEPTQQIAPPTDATTNSLTWAADIKQTLVKSRKDYTSLFHEFIYELAPPPSTPESCKEILNGIKTWIHIPYLPAFHQPGWMLAYIGGPYDGAWLESIFADIWAGITVGLTLIPQGLSYATLANLQPIQGLYAAIVPSAMYTFFGSSLQLAVGPVAVVSLLTGQIVSYAPDLSDPSACSYCVYA